MTAGQLLRTLRAVPFQPFFLFLVDGRQLLVRHPELLVLSAGGRIATLQDRDSQESIDVLMIVSIRPK
jgi:hypothetical protein